MKWCLWCDNETTRRKYDSDYQEHVCTACMRSITYESGRTTSDCNANQDLITVSDGMLHIGERQYEDTNYEYRN